MEFYKFFVVSLTSWDEVTGADNAISLWAFLREHASSLETEDIVNSIIPTVLNVLIPIAILGLVFFAFQFFSNSEKKAEIAKERIKYLLIALAAVFMLGMFIRGGIAWAKDNVNWNPTSAHRDSKKIFEYKAPDGDAIDIEFEDDDD